VQVGGADDGAELFQQEEDRAVLDQRAPVACAQHRALRLGELRLFEQGFRFLQESLAALRDEQRVQE
jgi:hypothetical protein